MIGKLTTTSNFRPARLSAIAFASVVAVVLMTCLPARADVYWSTSSGDWSNAANWSGSLGPTGTDNAWIVNGGTATVTTLDATCGTLSLGSSAGIGTVQMSAGSLSVNDQYVGFSGTGALTQSGGTNSCMSGLYLGYNSGSSGSYNLSGLGVLEAYYLGSATLARFVAANLSREPS